MAIIVEATAVADDIGEASRKSRSPARLRYGDGAAAIPRVHPGTENVPSGAASDGSGAGEQNVDGPLLQDVNQGQSIVRPSRLRSGRGASIAPRRYLVRSPLSGAGV